MASSINRREFLAGMAAGAAAAAGYPLYAADPTPAGPATAGLAEPVFRPLPLGSIRPTGWLGRQLRIQAEGLSGHLDEFWPDVAQSQWFGGKAEGWERAPYWLDGVIPLAWVLDDPALKAKVKGHIDYIVANQRPDGWFAPVSRRCQRQANTISGRSSSSTRCWSSITRPPAMPGSSRP